MEQQHPCDWASTDIGTFFITVFIVVLTIAFIVAALRMGNPWMASAAAVVGCVVLFGFWHFC